MMLPTDQQQYREECTLRTTFLEGMSHTASTVSVITTDGPAGRAGVTVSAMSSVSADTTAPLLLVCLHQASSACPVILKNGVFCVNVLRDDQSHISDVFAGRVKSEHDNKFACADWITEKTGAPRIVEPLVSFDCRIAQAELIGTHHVVFGEVAEVFLASRGVPLIYANRDYRRLAGPEPIRCGNQFCEKSHAYDNAA